MVLCPAVSSRLCPTQGNAAHPALKPHRRPPRVPLLFFLAGCVFVSAYNDDLFILHLCLLYSCLCLQNYNKSSTSASKHRGFFKKRPIGVLFRARYFFTYFLPFTTMIPFWGSDRRTPLRL
jgi:hypothetical protein